MEDAEALRVLFFDDNRVGRWYHRPPFAPSAPNLSVTGSVLPEIPGASCRDVLFRIYQIRRHRQLRSLREIVEMVGDAVSLTTVLKESVRIERIKLIRNMVRLISEEMKGMQGINDSLKVSSTRHPARLL